MWQAYIFCAIVMLGMKIPSAQLPLLTTERPWRVVCDGVVHSWRGHVRTDAFLLQARGLHVFVLAAHVHLRRGGWWAAPRPQGACCIPCATRSTTDTQLQTAGNLSSLFDIGGVLGGVAIGYLADTSGASALVSWGFVLSSVPVLYMYRTYGHTSMSINVVLMMLSGFFVNGPYALITTAVSADLVRWC